jgi:hypothetical protein
MPKHLMEAVAYHEGIPGHHLQISIAQESTSVPKFRTQARFTAFSEGWGLYAERLAKEMGAYQDPYSDFGRLSTEIWRAIRLVVDTGIHAKGWSEEGAIAYFMDNSAVADGAIKAEVRRYIAWPDRHAEDPRAETSGRGRAWGAVRHSRLPRHGARRRTAAARHSGTADRQLDRGGGLRFPPLQEAPPSRKSRASSRCAASGFSCPMPATTMSLMLGTPACSKRR